jgi:serine/threonine-protein kinase
VSEPLSKRALRKLLAVAAAGEPDGAPFQAGSSDFASRYEIVRELGRGGMGVVYEAVDRQLGRRCALKMIHRTLGAEEELRRRLAREALAAARLRHPHITAIYDATPDYISMQLVAGSPIDAIHRSERRLIVELMRDAARAVHHAHQQGVVHRDLKPSNLMVEGRHVFVVDFGLAKETAPDGRGSLSGALVGTPAFMPPEQAQGRNDAIDARTDVYALGATLHACLTGFPPFHGGELVGLLRRIAEEPPRAPGIDRDLDLVILKCLEKDPARRYGSAEALADDLDRWLQSEPVHARRPSLGYRLGKLLQRRKTLLRASGITALGATLVTALILGPIALHESTARAAASEALELSERAAVVLQDASGFTRLGDHPSAHHALDGGIAAAREFLERHEVPRVRYLLSRLLRARGQPDLALAELEAAIDGEPGLTEARFERGLMIAGRRELTEADRNRAIADLASALGAHASLTDVDLLFGRGELRRLEGEPREAMELLKEVLAYDTMHVGARSSLSRIALELGDQDLARHYAVSAVDLQQGFGPIYLARERGFLPTTILGLDGALVDFASSLVDGPDNALAFAHRGLVHLRRSLRLGAEGRHEDARAAVQSAIEDHDAALVIHPDLAGALNNRGVCQMQAERFFAAAGDSAAAAAARARAEADLSRAISRDAGLPEAHFNLGVFSLRSVDLFRKLGRASAAERQLDTAREALRQAIALAPANWPHLRACRARLDEAEAGGRGRG